MRFDQLIRPGMTVREIRVRHPETAPVFERLGFRESCDDCSLAVLARKYGLNAQDLVTTLNETIFRETRS